MKVLLVNKFHYMKGGSERYYFTLAETFQTLGHEVIFFAMQDEKNLPCAQEKYFVSNASVQGGVKSKLNMVLLFNFLLTPLWLSICYGQSFVVLSSLRLVKNVIKFPIDIALLMLVLKTCERYRSAKAAR